MEKKTLSGTRIPQYPITSITLLLLNQKPTTASQRPQTPCYDTLSRFVGGNES